MRANRGFLLVEATLTAVVIGVGLVFISRSLAANVKQLATIQQYDRLLQLAESTLDELAAQAQHAPPLAALTGDYDAPDAAYHWAVETQPLVRDDIEPDTMEEIVLTVSRRDERPPAVHLRTVWPSKWLREVSE